MRHVFLKIYMPKAYINELIQVDRDGRQTVLQRKQANNTRQLLGFEMYCQGLGMFIDKKVSIHQPEPPSKRTLSADGEELI